MPAEKVINRIENVLCRQIRPSLLAHGGDLKLLSFENGIVRVRFTGACSGCPSAELTLEAIVKEKLTEAVPEIQDVILEQAVSDELLSIARKLLAHDTSASFESNR